MCGIAGILNANGQPVVEARELNGMMNLLAHRGPDDEGTFLGKGIGLGHRRLSIIDLGTGHQPMHSRDGRLSIIYNGEVYNYLELRRNLIQKGYQFATSSDTEVILYLYDCFGTDCVQQLNGMFAFAIWDQAKQTLFAARDRFGIKPFYYWTTAERLAFASEIKAFKALDSFRAQPDVAGLSDYLHFQFCLGDKTLFQGVKKLEPGHYLVADQQGGLQIARYWDLDYTIDTTHTEAYFTDRLQFLLGDSVRLNLRSDVPVGAHLSGGLDSSTVVCLAAQAGIGEIKTFTGGFKEGPAYDETPYARMVAEHAGVIYFEVFPGVQDFLSSIEKIIYFLDEPLAGPGVFPQYFVSKLAREHVKVVLGGQGGDEIFGGYARYLIAYLEECLRGAIDETFDRGEFVVTFESILSSLSSLKQYKPLLTHFWKDGLFEPPDRRYFRLVTRGSTADQFCNRDIVAGTNPFESFSQIFNRPGLGSLFNKMTNFDLKTLLPALLQVEDRTSMAVSLESRVPLLDHRIAELLASVPATIKFKDGRLKHLFLKVIQNLLPAPVLQRKDKMGFPVPLNEWSRNGLRDYLYDTLLSQSARESSFYEAGEIRKALEHEQPFGRQVWGLLCLELWRRGLSSPS